MDKETQDILSTIDTTDEEHEDSVALAFTSYARKDKLRRRNGRLYGNWNSSFGAACVDQFGHRYIHESSIISLHDVGRCDRNGKEVVRCEHH